MEFFFGLISLTRFGFNLSLFDRPITFGLLGALLTGNPFPSIGIGIFFELIWLDFFPAGTFIPPHQILPTFLSLSLASYLEIYSPENVMPILFLTLPLAWIGTRLEHWQRNLQNKNYNKLVRWTDHEPDSFRPESLVLGSLVQIALFNCILFVVCFVVLFVILEYVFIFWSGRFEGLAWSYLWLTACVGGILSLRIRRAYEVFVVCVGVVLLILLIM
jgi:PTS system mannose-specific IIC component